jgi:ribosome-binding protein aMBF1 (putative translation factor)
MAKNTIHKLEIKESGPYLLVHEEHFQSLSNTQQGSEPDELQFLSHLGEEIFTVGFVIKFFREKRDWNLRELGEKSKVPFSQISLYENDKVEPELMSIEKLTSALGSSFENAIKLAIKIKNRNSQKSA